MKSKKSLRWKLIIIPGVIVITIYFTVYLKRVLPIISGYGSKVMCSCVFVSGRDPDDVRKAELDFFPISLGKYEVNYEDSSVTGSLWGMAKVKTYFRPGFGCTLVPDGSNANLQPKINPYAFRAPLPDTIPWPDGEKVEHSPTPGLDSAKLTASLEWAFSEIGREKPVRTRAVIVLYDEQIVAERYASGFDKTSILTGWSMAKSILSALVGIYVKDNGLDINKPAPIAEWENQQEKQAVTTTHLLQQTSGIDFDEDYSRLSHVTTMLYKENDMGFYAAQQKLRHEPGTVFNYCGGNTNLLSLMLKRKMSYDEYIGYPYTRLFNKIGMRSAIMETDVSGTFVGSSYVFATARDWARFGLLYYRKGKWNNEQILSEEWIQKTVEPSLASDGLYGFQFLLNRMGKNNAQKRFPSVPEDLFFTDGYEGQNVYIIPSRKLVIVRLALTRGSHFDEDQFLSQILSAFPH